LFSHFEQRGKCEWFEGGLDAFVLHYNDEYGTIYSHTECLDIVRVGEATPKKPEVLVTDTSTGKQMVIERKSVVWPPSYIQRHKNGHNFAEAIWKIIGERYRDACYELSVSGKQLDAIDSRQIKRMAHEVAATILELPSSSLPVQRSVPIGWRFRRANPDEHDGRAGIAVVQSDSMGFEEFDNESAKVGTAAAMEAELSAAVLKFDSYTEARKVVLLDFYGDELSEDDVPPLLERIAVPDNIDEIWMTGRDWVSEDEFEIVYMRIFEHPKRAT
jgi:hypothetical protein